MEALRDSDSHLISFLSSSLPESDLDKAQMLLAAREKSLKTEMECDFLDELSLKEVEKIEAEHRCYVAERTAHALEARCVDLEGRVQNGVEMGRTLEEVMRRCDLLECAMGELQKEVLEWTKKHEEVVINVLELMQENSRLRSLPEQNRKPVEAKSIPGVIVPTDIDLEDCKERKLDSLSIPTPTKMSGLTKVSGDIEGEVGSSRIPSEMLRKRRLEKTDWGNETYDGLGVSNYSSCQDKQGDVDRVKRALFQSSERREADEITANSHMESSFGDEYPLRNIKRNHSTPEGTKKMLVLSDSDDHGKEVSGSDSENSSLGGFIVSGSECSQRNPTSSSANDEVSACDNDESTTDVDLEVVLSKISGKREGGNKWEYEADMLASFAKDPKLCMEAVCALYRMQTVEERSVKGALHLNNRGFSQRDAYRGSKMAEFLMDGDPQCRLRKSVEELELYDRTGPDYCQMLASYYSKQLFNIYKNCEDPFFPPP